MGIAGATNVDVRLVGPTPIDTGGAIRTVRTVRFAADDPRAAVHELLRPRTRAAAD